MTELDLEIPGLAEELIAEYGKEIGYTQRNPGEYNTETSMAIPVDNPVTVRGIVEPYRGQRMIAGLVEAGDMKVTAARSSFDQFDNKPSTGDICYIDGEPFNVINVEVIYSGELIAVYEFQVRQG